MELTLLILWPVLVTTLSFVVKINSLTSVILFLIIPAVLLSFKSRKYVTKSILFSLLAIPTGLGADLLGNATGSWTSSSSVLKINFFGRIPIEDLFWAYFLTYFVIIFYKTYFERHRKREVFSKKFRYLVLYSAFVSILFVIIYLYVPKISLLQHFYVVGGFLGLLIPSLFVLRKFPKLRRNILVTAVFFLYLGIIYEYVAVTNGWWSFPKDTNFIGWVSLVNIKIPIEEILFWPILWSTATLSYYECFVAG